MKTEPQPVTPFERLRELEAKATPGPWKHDLNGFIAPPRDDGEWGPTIVMAHPDGTISDQDSADCELIAESRNLLPALLNSHTELLDALKELLRHADKDSPACDCEYIAAREAASLAIQRVEGNDSLARNQN